MSQPSGRASLLRALASGVAHPLGMLRAVPGNARVLVITEGLAAIPSGWYSTYLSLYMLALGVSEVQIGLFAGIATCTQLLSTLVGGHAADRFGRKITLVVGDVICWVLPIFLYAIARNPWYFLVGQLFNGFVYLVIPAFECLFVEDVEQTHHPSVFGTARLAYALASLLTPVAGLIVAAMGVVRGGRLIMAVTSAACLLTSVFRQLTLKETARGRERMAATAGSTPADAVRSYLHAVRAMLGRRDTARLLGVRALGAFVTVVWGTYLAIYLTDATGIALPSSLISLLPLVSAATTIVVIALSSRRIRRGDLKGNLLLGQGLWIAGALLVVLSPSRTIVLALASAVLTAVSTAYFQPASQAAWARLQDEKNRAQEFSAASAVVVLCSLPAGPLAGLLYTVSPRAPFLLATLLQAAALGLLARLRLPRARDAAIG